MADESDLGNYPEKKLSVPTWHNAGPFSLYELYGDNWWTLTDPRGENGPSRYGWFVCHKDGDDPVAGDVSNLMHEDDAFLLMHALNALHKVNVDFNAYFMIDEADERGGNDLHDHIRAVLRYARRQLRTSERK